MLFVEISTLFISLPIHRIDSKIEEAQRHICEFLDLDRSSLWQFLEQDPDQALLTHFYQSPECLPVAYHLKAKERFPWLTRKIFDNEVVALSKLAELPTEATIDRDNLNLHGTKSGVYVPLTIGQGPPLGILTFADIRKERNWTEKVIKGFKLLSQIFSNALARKKAEMALRDSEARLFLATNAAGVGLWDMRLDTDSVCVSGKTGNLFHFGLDEKLDLESFLKVIHREDSERVNQAVQLAIHSGVNFLEEFRVVLSDGKVRWIAARGQRHPGLAGGSDRLLGVSLDITDRKQLEQEMEERLRFETLLAEISSRFVNLPANRLNTEIEDALRRICELLGLDLVALWQWSDNTPTLFTLTHLYSTLDGPIPYEMSQHQFPWYAQQMLSDRIVAFSSLQELPAEAAHDMESCRLSGVKSNLTFPLSVGGDSPIGILGLNTMRSERCWPEVLVKRLRRVAQIFTNALLRTRMDGQLQKHLSEIEELKNRLEEENIYLHEEVKLLAEHSEILGQSPAIKNILAQAEQVARTDSTVLLLGETGTGKGLLARAIHNMSLRKNRPLVTINCASLPPSLIENELFGREKGAYTGALTKMIGRFELADGSTLFLDEIGELPLDLQSKLLRVLEEGTLERLGSTKSLHINVRIIAATNRDINQEVANGKFRQDLFYRLNVFPILISPLRERAEDIPLLTRAFVREFNKKMGKQIERIPRKTLQALESYSWQGNLRELRNVIERAMIVSKGETLAIQMPGQASSETGTSRNLEDMTRREILAVLEETRWRIAGPKGAAKILGLKKSTLYSKMQKLGISRTEN